MILRIFGKFLKISRLIFANFRSRELSSFFQFAKLSSRETKLLAHVFHELLQFPSQRLEPKNSMITRFLTF